MEEFAEFAAGLDALVVESDMEASKTTFAELYAELQTTSDAVRLTKIYNDLVALRDALLESSAFATGGYRCLSGNTAWGDGENWTKLVDGDTTTKWGGGMPSEGSFVIFKQYAAGQYNVYKLVTGNDTKGNPGRNWKKWKIYGASPKLVSGTPEAEQVTRDLSSWTLLDQKEDIGQDLLPADNFTSAFFSFSEAWAKSYKYFKIEVEEAYNGSVEEGGVQNMCDVLDRVEKRGEEKQCSAVCGVPRSVDKRNGYSIPDYFAGIAEYFGRGRRKGEKIWSAIY